MKPNQKTDIEQISTRNNEWDKAYSLPTKDDRISASLKDETFLKSDQGQRFIEEIGSVTVESFEE